MQQIQADYEWIIKRMHRYAARIATDCALSNDEAEDYLQQVRIGLWQALNEGRIGPDEAMNPARLAGYIRKLVHSARFNGHHWFHVSPTLAMSARIVLRRFENLCFLRRRKVTAEEVYESFLADPPRTKAGTVYAKARWQSSVVRLVLENEATLGNPLSEGEEENYEFIEGGTCFERQIEDRVLLQIITAGLNDTEFSALVLISMDYEYHEVARILGLAEKSISTTVWLARKKCARAASDLGIGFGRFTGKFRTKSVANERSNAKRDKEKVSATSRAVALRNAHRRTRDELGQWASGTV